MNGNYIYNVKKNYTVELFVINSLIWCHHRRVNMKRHKYLYWYMYQMNNNEGKLMFCLNLSGVGVF